MELKKNALKGLSLITFFFTINIIDRIGVKNIPINFGIILITSIIAIIIIQNIRYTHKSVEEISSGELRYFRTFTIGVAIIFTIFLGILLLEQYNLILFNKYATALYILMGIITIITLVLSFTCYYRNYKDNKLKELEAEKTNIKKTKKVGKKAK